jgi:hypothetical protein
MLLYIFFSFLDAQVMAFLSLIASRITNVRIELTEKMSHLDENGLATAVNQLLQLCRETIPTISSIFFAGCMSNIQFLADVDNKMGRIQIDCYGMQSTADTDIPILMQLLASPRADGQQRVISMHFWLRQLTVAQKFLDEIKKVCKFGVNPKYRPDTENRKYRRYFFSKYFSNNSCIRGSTSKNQQA